MEKDKAFHNILNDKILYMDIIYWMLFYYWL